jgi:ferredoxin
VNTSTNSAHCGACGTVCPSGQVCNNGQCGANNCGTAVTYTTIQGIWDSQCTRCHGANSPSAGLSLAAANSYLNLTTRNACGKALVVPGNPNGSYIVEKLEPNPSCGGRMPAGGALSTAQIDQIRRWICHGAQNN